MVTRNTRTRRAAHVGEVVPATRTRRQRPAAEPEAAPVRRRRPAPEPVQAAPAGRDLTQYRDYTPTPYHKAFATWLVKEVGYRPSAEESTKAAFLQGVALATAARPAFNDSEWLENWRTENNITKRGRKPASEVAEEAPEPRRARRAKAAPEPEPVDEDDDDFEDDDEIDDEDDTDDDDFDDDESDDDDDDADDEDDDFEDEAPAPATVKRGRPAAKAAPTKAAPAKRAPAKAASTKAQPARRGRPAAKSDDDFAF